MQDLPLLPGEFAFLKSKGWDRQFENLTHQKHRYDFNGGTVFLEMVSSPRVGCACDHETRTIICRLYPLLPVFNLDGQIVATEPIGIYEELEQLEGYAPACQISSLPFDQLNLFLAACELLAANPAFLFYVAVYREVKRHIAQRIATWKRETGNPAFAIFEGALLQRRLIDHEQLRESLSQLNSSFREKYGGRFNDEKVLLENYRPT
jgi:hypothetical protein